MLLLTSGWCWYFWFASVFSPSLAPPCMQNIWILLVLFHDGTLCQHFGSSCHVFSTFLECYIFCNPCLFQSSDLVERPI